jgi:NADH dehydrogenase/NADH:ubiquinone oxidoreductase subunit G
MDQWVQRKVKEKSEAYKAIRANRKERSDFRKKIKEVVSKVKVLEEEQQAGSAKAVNENFVKSKVLTEGKVITDLIKENIVKVASHKYIVIEKAYKKFSTKCSVVNEKLNILIQLCINNYQGKDYDDLIRKLKRLAKNLKQMTIKEEELKAKKNGLEVDIEELNKEYKVLVDSKKKSKSSIWPIVLLTPITIVLLLLLHSLPL